MAKSYEQYQWNCLAPVLKSGRSSIMVWDAITSFTKSYLVLIPPNKHTTKDFLELVYEFVLEHCYYHHENYKHLILMEDGAPVHHNNAP
jgi:hypothetical protein